jgi:cytochrome c
LAGDADFIADVSVAAIAHQVIASVFFTLYPKAPSLNQVINASAVGRTAYPVVKPVTQNFDLDPRFSQSPLGQCSAAQPTGADAMPTTSRRHLILTLTLGAAATLANAEMKPADVTAARALFANNGCANCHEMNGKADGPAMRDIAKRYKGKKINAELARRIREGSAGRWGDSESHPPQGVLEPSEAKLLADWVLTGAP